MVSPPQGFYKDKKRLPTMQEVQNPYKVTEGKTVNEDMGNYILNWYWLHFLPAAAQASLLPKDHRYYKLPVQPLEGDESNKAAVTKESEAFGVLVCLNCYKKWSEFIPAKHDDPDFEPPQYDPKKPETFKWHLTEWTKATNGQKEGEGWAPGAYVRLSELIRDVKKRRSADKKTNFTTLKACLRYVQSQNGIEEGSERPNKRKRNSKKGVEKAKYQAVEELSDDDWEPESGEI